MDLCILLYACYPALLKYRWTLLLSLKIMRWEGIKKLGNYILMQTLFVVCNNVEASDLIMPCFLLFYSESIGAVATESPHVNGEMAQLVERFLHFKCAAVPDLRSIFT